jgi:uncharacterized membrane protein
MTPAASEAPTAPQPALARRIAWGGFWLGFALGGFFDGIILHQILQWHHLLSGVAPTATLGDLRFQVLADGVFHAAHYLLAALGLWLLWRGRRGLASPGADHRLIGWALLGFGAWHVVDAVLVHWILQLHRIRMDVDNPLLWDLLWLVPFGVLFVVAGFWLLRRLPPPDDGGSSRGTARSAAAGLALAVLVAGPVAALPPAGPGQDDKSLVVFRPGMDFLDVVAATDAVGGRVVWRDAGEGVWLIALGPDARPATLYRHGALMVAAGPFAVGCLSWTRL